MAENVAYTASVEDSSSTGSTGSESPGPSSVMSESIPLRRAQKIDKIDRDGEERVLSLREAGKKREAIERLMLMYGDAIVAHLARLTRDAEIAKDLSQQTFLEAYRSLESFQGRSSLRTWLFSIARNRGIDEIKRNRRTELREDFDVLKELAVPPEASVRGEERAKRRALEDCLARLPDETREQLLLRMTEGFTYNELGDRSQEAHGTVQVRISRALQQLRKCLRAKGFGR